jgi:isopentenyl diphosphate isomerase/L-lactate dehydrogenase-like FMN-dependent dehydrogenase
MYEGLAAGVGGEDAPAGRTVFTWDDVKRLRDATSMKLLLKGIVTGEDAELAIAHGTDGIVVSNHGGRAEASLRSTIESLPDVAAGVARRIPIILDSGVRRGTDIFKALALGATAVGIGRPYVWGLSAFGQEGVEAVLDILRRELQLVMRQAGATSIDKIAGTSLVDRLGGMSWPNR